MKPEVILFRWEGVLDRVGLEGIEKILASCCGNLNSADRTVLEARFKEYSRGHLSDDYFWNTFVRSYFNVNTKIIHKIRPYFSRVSPNKKLWEALPHLKERYDLGILSDCPQEKVSPIYRSAQIELNYFSAGVYFSGASIEYGLNNLGVDRKKSLLVDTSLSRLEIATRLFVQGHLFTTTQNFLDSINGARH